MNSLWLSNNKLINNNFIIQQEVAFTSIEKENNK